MISAFRFVKGAVSKKTLLPVLTSAHVYNGRVQAGNGKVCIDAPCELTQEFTVSMEEFLKAADCCNNEPDITVTDSSIELRSGKVKIKLPRLQDIEYPRQELGRGPVKEVNFDLLGVIKELEPYIGEDASREWCCGILFRDSTAWATNNATLVKFPLSECEWNFILPVYLAEEILRIGLSPKSYLVDESKLTLLYEDGSWIAGSLLYGEWPPVEKIDLVADSYVTCGPELVCGVGSVFKFCPDPKFPAIVFTEEQILTTSGDKGASFDYTGLRPGCYRGDLLLPVLQSSTEIGFVENKLLFRNSNISGALIGVRV